MRVLLDEHLPLDLARDLHGHDVQTVVGRGWAGVKNGDLLRLMRGGYDALVTMDHSLEFQQNISALPFGIVLVRAPSQQPSRASFSVSAPNVRVSGARQRVRSTRKL